MADRVAQAMRSVPRAAFLPWSQRHRADSDEPLRIGDGATCSQPTTVRHMLYQLDPQPGDRVLDVGSGSGWTCALLAYLVSPGGSVHGVELIPRLVTAANRRLTAQGVTNASVLPAVGTVLGLPDQAPFDRILVSAMAQSLPQTLVDQLAVGGRMVIPVSGRMVQVDRREGGLDEKVEGHYRFVPLRGA
jgi:protein-L-isoaspartate(D-aspartate) O-methyltransferase